MVFKSPEAEGDVPVEEADAVAEAAAEELLGNAVAQAFAPSSVEMISEPVEFAMVTGSDQIIVVGLPDAPYRLITAVSKFVWRPTGYVSGTVKVCVMFVRMFDRSIHLVNCVALKISATSWCAYVGRCEMIQRMCLMCPGTIPCSSLRRRRHRLWLGCSFA